MTEPRRFRWPLLNGLAYELVMTRKSEKFTFFHLLFGLLPALAIAGVVGRTIDHDTASWSLGSVVVPSLVAGSLGLLSAWALPRVLWYGLRLLIRFDRFTMVFPDSDGDEEDA